MKPLKKPTKAKNSRHGRRFDEVCREIRRIFHLEKWRSDYDIDAKSEDGAFATTYTPEVNKRIWIDFRPEFWEADGKEQLKTLIHEHVHCILCEYTQLVQYLEQDLGKKESEYVERMRQIASEHITDHLEAVIYDLINDRFKSL